MRINRPLADCKTGELHLADAIQPIGVLVAVDEDGVLGAVSANSALLVGEPPQQLLGTDAGEALPRALADRVLSAGSPDLPAAPEGGVVPLRPHLRTVRLDGREVTTAVHVRGDHTILELETSLDHDATRADATETVQRLSDRLEVAGSAPDAASLLLDAIVQLTGFDRAMLYWFLPGWHGEVLDERLAPGVEGYRGLRFPAGDIPENARRLHVAKRQRAIAEVAAETVPVYGAREGMTLDLAGSELRAVHPTHVEYLNNMGVAASFSVSIVADGRLWGLIACHHFEPHRLGLVTRQACELATSIVSVRIAGLERLGHLRGLETRRTALDRTTIELERGGEARLGAIVLRLRTAFEANGVIARIGGGVYTDGDLPRPDTMARLLEVCGTGPVDSVTVHAQVPPELAHDAEAVRAASGILHVPIEGNGYVIFLRCEQVETVDWAGRPAHAEAGDTPDGPLGPGPPSRSGARRPADEPSRGPPRTSRAPRCCASS